LSGRVNIIISPDAIEPAGTETLTVPNEEVVSENTVGTVNTEIVPAATAGSGTISADARKLRQNATDAIMLTSFLWFSNPFPPLKPTNFPHIKLNYTIRAWRVLTAYNKGGRIVRVLLTRKYIATTKKDVKNSGNPEFSYSTLYFPFDSFPANTLECIYEHMFG